MELIPEHSVHAPAFSFGQKGICNLSEPARWLCCFSLPATLSPSFFPQQDFGMEETIQKGAWEQRRPKPGFLGSPALSITALCSARRCVLPPSLPPSIFTWATLSTVVADICLYMGNVSQFLNWEAGLQRLCSPLGSPQPCSAGSCELSPLMCF